MNKPTHRKFKISRWIMLSIAILLNAFLIAYSSINDEITVSWNKAFSNFFTSMINNLTAKEVKNVSLEGLDVCLSNETNYEYNYLSGYKLEEIPLGSAKQIECSFSPEDATDKSITYSAEPADMVTLNQSGSTLSVVGMKVGECVITAKSNDGGYESSVNVKVVDTVAPQSFEVSLEKTSIAIGTTQTIDFDIDGGVLAHDELINFRYYDTRKLNYSSLDESIAKVDKYGVIYPQSIGSTKITVSNDVGVSKSLNISVTSGTTPTPYSDLSISGSDVCYANDMILDQNSKKNHYQLTPKDGTKELNPEGFIWESSNELLVKVDKHGVIRGFRKSSNDDETATITAKSKLTGQTTTFDVTVKNQLPTSMTLQISGTGEILVDEKEYTVTLSNNVTIRVSYNVPASNYNVLVSSSNEEVMYCSNEGNRINLILKNEGKCTLSITSVINPELSYSINFVVLKSGAISNDEIRNVEISLRKSLGHAAVFMVAQIFTFLAFFMFFYERKWYVWSSMSLGEGLFISILSEFIQFLVPTRTGAVLDVLIDFAGVVVGAGLTLLGIFIVHKIKEKKSKKIVEKTSEE